MSINISETPYGIETCVCENCNWRGGDGDLVIPKHLYARVGAGEMMPAGECPECGSLAHVVTEKSRAADMSEEMFLILRSVMETTQDKDLKKRIKTVFSNIFEDGGFSRHQFNLVSAEENHENYMNDVGGQVFDGLSNEETKYIFKMVKRGRREDAIREIFLRKHKG